MLNVEGIHTQYGKIKVLSDVSFEIKPGEIVALIGTNGAGKSTFLKTISGLVRPTQGRITFMNQDIQGLAPEKIVHAGIAHVPEGRHVFARQTVMTNLEIGAFIRKDADEIKNDIEKYFKIFPILGERRNQPAGTLSGGEQQMLAIARGLMARPKLLLLDEPSMGLAPFLVNEIFRIIGQLHEQGIAIVLVEQNVKKALKITRRAYVMELGKILYHGDSKDLMADDRVRKCYLGEA
ncbi:MAG: ABC transporter ATP-binding protein [Desulfatirhabdiaceae bacterium]|nr:ABC transporter ATP-binding protein [Desulfatirhabdiaceae bacterium]